ncbi:MAG: hypothetical protein AAB389_03745 [Patescibacteria group bacterium]
MSLKATLVLIVCYVVAKFIALGIGMNLNAQYPFWKVLLYNSMFLSAGVVYGMIVGWKNAKEDKE